MAFNIENDLLVTYVPNDDGEAVVIPDDIRGIGQHSFENSKIASVVIPNGVVRVETNAFAKCCKITTIELPESVNAVYSNAFAGCLNLNTVKMPENLLHYGEHIFAADASLVGISSNSGKVSLTCKNAEKNGLTFTVPSGYTNQTYVGMALDAVCKSSLDLTVKSYENNEIIYKLWIAFDKENPDLQEAVRKLFHNPKEYDFELSDSLFRSMRSTKNKAYYAYRRLKYPYNLNDEYIILFRNFLKRFATNALSFFIDDDSDIHNLEFAEKIGMYEKADLDELIDYSNECKKPYFAAAFEEAKNRRESAEATSVATLTPAQIRKLNEPVIQRLQEKKAKLRRAAAERLAASSAEVENLTAMLLENVRGDNRAQVRIILGATPIIPEKTLIQCCNISIENNDSYMLQDLMEKFSEVSPDIAADLLEKAAISGMTDVVKFLCVYCKSINQYNRALGYALRQADYDMCAAILSRDDQKFKTAKYIKDIFKTLSDGPEKRAISSRLVDVQYLEYNYYDDDFRYMLKNCNRNGLIGDEFYEVHYNIVPLADDDKRIAFIRRMKEAGYFTDEMIEYICFLAIDSDEVPIAATCVELGATDVDVPKCSIMANHVTVVASMGDLLTSNPKRPSDDKFNFILSRLKPGEKLNIRKQYLLSTADIARALTMLKYSAPEYCEDLDMTVEYFTRHGSVEAVELMCAWGLEDKCFEMAQQLKKTEIVAWILNYKNEHTKRADLDDRFAL